MTQADVRDWLGARHPAPPSVLAERLEVVLAACPPDGLTAALTMSDAMNLLGVAALESLEGREPAGRDVAMDLLAADAFVTYAFEAAAEEGAPIERAAARVLARVAP